MSATKSMSLSAFNKLKKTMMMTTSENDAEALVALRIANKVIAEQGYTWDDVFHRLVKVEDSIEAMEVEKPMKDQIEEAFERISRNSKAYNSFIRSLHEQFTESGSLSIKQREILFQRVNEMRS